MNLVEMTNVSFSYNFLPILKNVNLNVNKSDFICLIGENGAGKSTLIKCLLGLEKNYEGSIKKSGQVGYLPQRTEVQSNFPTSVFEVLLSGTIIDNMHSVFYTKKNKEKVNKILIELEIENLKDKCFSELSGGQQQRVLIGRALCSGRDVLILDEPINTLDPKIALDIYELLKKINNNGITIIMVSHDVDRALNYCNRVVVLKKGEKIYDDTSKKYKGVF